MLTLTQIRDGARECAVAWERVDTVGSQTGGDSERYDVAFREAEQVSIKFAISAPDLAGRLRHRIGGLGTVAAYRELEAAADEAIHRFIWGALLVEKDL